MGHTTRDCIALKDEIERLARDRNMWRFIQKFINNRIGGRRPPPNDKNRNYNSKKDDNPRDKDDGNKGVHHVRGQTPIINVIAGGKASGGDTN
jgi:hypothetical protein